MKRIIVLAVLSVLIAVLLLFLYQRSERRRDGAPAREGGHSSNTSSSGTPAVAQSGNEATRDGTHARNAQTLNQDGITCSGFVYEADTLEPLAGVNVLLRAAEDAWGTFSHGDCSPRAAAITEEDGSYRISVPHSLARRSMLTFEKPGYCQKQVRGLLGVSEELPAVYLAEGLKVSGEVVAADGKAVTKGMVFALTDFTLEHEVKDSLGGQRTVSVGYSRSDFTPPAELDARGYFELYLTEGWIAVRAEVAGFAPGYSEPVQLEPDRSTHLRVVVYPGETLRGTVTNDAGEPVVDAQIFVKARSCGREPDAMFYEHPVTGLGRSAADGSFAVKDLPDTVRFVRVEHPEYVTHYEGEIKERRTSDTQVDVVLERGQWLVGTLEHGDGVPVAAAHGVLQLRGLPVMGVNTDHRGEFRSEVLPLGETTASIHVEGALPADLEWPAGTGEHRLGRISLSRGQSLQVRVVDPEGQPIPRAEVTATVLRDGGTTSYSDWLAHTKLTREDGRAELTGLKPRHYKISAAQRGFSPTNQEVEIRRGATTEPLVLTLSPSGRIQATILNADGSPSSGVESVLLSALHQTEITRGRRLGVAGSPVLTDARGQLTIPDVPSTVPLLLDLGRNGRWLTRIDIAPLAANETRDLGAIHLPRTFRASGRVTAGDGAPIPGACIEITEGLALPEPMESPFDGNWRSCTASCDANGRFEVDGLVEGDHAWRASALGFAPSKAIPFTLAGRDVLDLAIALESAVTWHGTVVMEDGTPVAEAEVLLMAIIMNAGDPGRYESSTTDSQGDVTLHDLPDRPFQVVFARRTPDAVFSLVFYPRKARDLPERIVVPAGGSIECEVVGSSDADSGDLMLRLVEQTRPMHAAGLSMPVPGLSNGRSTFRITNVQPGSYRAELVAGDEERSVVQTVTVTAGETADVRLALEERSHTIAIVVSDSDGAPVAGAAVEVFSPSPRETSGGSYGRMGYVFYYGPNQQFSEIATNSRGEASVAIGPEEPFSVVVRAAGLALVEIHEAQRMVAGDELSVVMEDESSFVLHVTDPSGNPIDGIRAEVSLLEPGAEPDSPPSPPSKDDPYSRWSRVSETESGVARIGELPGGSFRIRFDRDYEFQGAVAAQLAGGEEKHIHYQLAPRVLVAGSVVINGVRATGGSVLFKGPNIAGHAVVGAMGTFEMDFATPGDCDVSYQSEAGIEFPKRSITIVPNALIELVFEGASLRGTVLLPDGSPVAEISGILEGETRIVFKTDKEGKFERSLVPIGTYRWQLAPPAGYVAVEAEVTVSGDTEVRYQFQAGR